MARFSKIFQLLTVVLVVAIVNVYVMGAPKASTDPKKADAPATTTDTNTNFAGAENVANAKVTPAAVASEKLKLAPGSKVDFNRIFSRTEIASRATVNHNFLNGKTAARDLFKAPPRTGMAPQDSDKDSGGGGSKGTWIALGVIAAVVTVAVIGLRHDRSHPAGSSANVP
jgi:hypothetical protein